MSKIWRILLALTVTSGTLLGAAPSPEYVLGGSVRDRALGTPISGARVALVTAGQAVVTSEDGTFEFRERPAQGPDQLVITHPDYRTVRIPLGDLGPGGWSLDITLMRSAGQGAGDTLEREAR